MTRFVIKKFMHLLLSIGLLVFSATVSFAEMLTINGPTDPVNGAQYYASGGTAPYNWCISKGNITQDGVVNVNGQCGNATITVMDNCGEIATITVRMPHGVWVNTESSHSTSTCNPSNKYGPVDCITFGTSVVRLYWSWFDGYWWYCSDFSTHNCVAEKRVVLNIKNLVSGNTYSWNTFRYENPTYCSGRTPASLICSDCGVSAISKVFLISSNKTTYEWKCNDGANGVESACNFPPKSCNCSIQTTFAGDSAILSPVAGGNITFRGSISEESGQTVSWTLDVLGRTYTGSTASVLVSWDGKIADGTVVTPGSYSATLTATTADGQCSDSKTINFTVTPTIL